LFLGDLGNVGINFFPPVITIQNKMNRFSPRSSGNAFQKKAFGFRNKFTPLGMAFICTSAAARNISSILLVVCLVSLQASAAPIDPADYRQPDNPQTTAAGLNFDYYEGTWEALPDFTGLAARKLGSVINIDLAPRTRENDFAFRFTGFIEAPVDGVYTLYTTSDDGSRLQIGSTTVVDNDGMHDAREASGTIGLKKGKHAITITYFSHLGASVLFASWEGPGIAKQLIPGTAFTRTGDPIAAWRMEAEGAILNGPLVLNSAGGYTGSGFADYQAAGDNILWFGNTPKADFYQLTFRYALAHEAVNMRLEINTSVDSVINFPSTGSWDKWGIVTFKTVLNGGSNTIRLVSMGGGDFHLDHLIFGYAGVTTVVVATADDDVAGGEAGAAMMPYPNPSTGKLYVDWQTQRSEPIEVELVNVNGQVMKSQTFSELRQGTNTLMMDAAEVNNGVYWMRVRHGHVRKAASVVISK